MGRIGEMLGLYEFDTQSILYASRQVKSRLEPYGNARLEDLVDEALQLTDVAADRELDWDSRKDATPQNRAEATRTDNRIDKTLSAIHQVIVTRAQLGPESEQGRMAREMRSELFPSGVYPLTSPRFQRQHMHVEKLLERLEGPFSEHVDVLGLGQFVEQLAELNETFGDQIETGGDDEVTFDQVREARVEARDAFHRVVFAIFGDYCKEPETREDLFAPIRAQNERIGRYIDRRGETPTVDPDSGEPTDPTRNGDGESPEDGDGSDSSDDSSEQT